MLYAKSVNGFMKSTPRFVLGNGLQGNQLKLGLFQFWNWNVGLVDKIVLVLAFLIENWQNLKLIILIENQSKKVIVIIWESNFVSRIWIGG